MKRAIQWFAAVRLTGSRLPAATEVSLGSGAPCRCGQVKRLPSHGALEPAALPA